ncbi:MAG TPA: histidine phosphatase family protein [Herpetosiphonaceae bacterium]
MGKRILHLVRHGQTDHTAIAFDQLGNGLTDLGREQAELTAQRLKQLPISIIHHSPLRRAAETAAIIADQFPEVPLRPARLLQECIPYLPAAFVEWYTQAARNESLTRRQAIPSEMKRWLNLWPAGTEWELIEQGMSQARRAFEKYFIPTPRAERHEVLVCHGNILRYFVCRALEVSEAAWIHTDVHNCGISEITIDSSGRVMLVSHNDTGHLPYPMRTYV